jgi:hypothetical protein
MFQTNTFLLLDLKQEGKENNLLINKRILSFENSTFSLINNDSDVSKSSLTALQSLLSSLNLHNLSTNLFKSLTQYPL